MTAMTRLPWPAVALVTLCNCGSGGTNATEGPEHAGAVKEVAEVELAARTGEPMIATTPAAQSDGTNAGAQKLTSSCGLRAELGPGSPNMGSTLTLINDGPKPVKLVVPGDGSEAGWRTPVLSWVAKKNGKPVAERDGGRCGMMNPIKEDEVFTLAPGERKTIAEWVGRPNVDPGTYEVELRYTNDPTLDARKGAAATNVEALIGTTDACEVTTKSVQMSI